MPRISLASILGFNLSCCRSAIPPVIPDAGKAEPDKKLQKRSAGHSFLAPCDERSGKKLCVPKVKVRQKLIILSRW
jgi:hypothetical protein